MTCSSSWYSQDYNLFIFVMQAYAPLLGLTLLKQITFLMTKVQCCVYNMTLHELCFRQNTIKNNRWFDSQFNRGMSVWMWRSSQIRTLDGGDAQGIGAQAARRKKKEQEKEREAGKGKHSRYSCVPVGVSFNVTASLPHPLQSCLVPLLLSSPSGDSSCTYVPVR